MKIVFLDAKTLGEELSFDAFYALGEVLCYDYSSPGEALVRTRDADVVITNKIRIDENSIGEAKKLKLVCTTGTGTNHMDLDYLKKRGIAYRNVTDYCTDSVAQHTFALLFYLLEKLAFYDSYVKEGNYCNDRTFSHFTRTFHELSGMTWGIIGLGSIGRRVADLAKAFGCRVIYYSASGKPAQAGYTQTDLTTLLLESDIVSVHAPLNEYTNGLMDEEAFKKMKPSAIFLNTGRGQIVNEEALAAALENGTIAAAGLDVLAAEPMRKDNPLRRITDSTKLIITPHIAWATKEARTRVLLVVAGQIRDCLGL